MTERIGVVGLGNMGGPMAENLLAKHGELIVHDRRRETAEALLGKGAWWADDVRSLASQADIVLTSLPGPPQIEEFAFGERGLFSALRPGSLWIDASTNDPALAGRLASEARDRGCAFLDAPVTGGVIGARGGSLKIMADGEPAVIERARVVLSAIAASVVHCGPAGTGSAMKLIVNFLGIAHTALAAEALTLGRAGGLAPEIMLSVLAGCWGDNAMLADIVRTAGAERHWGFGLSLARKDIALAERFARDQGLATRLGEATGAALGDCGASGSGEDDLWCLVEATERRAKTTIA